MRAPDFWWTTPDHPALAARLLAPLTVVWRIGAWWRARRARPYRAPVPVICIGNLIAGGAGKTPMVAALLMHLAGAGRTAHVVSRGHGGRRAGPHRVDPRRDTHSDVGDEPLMLAALAPVWVARDRAAGVRAAATAGAELILLDDGLQNPGVVKDRSIVMVDAVQGFGNGRLIPAGPLREPVAAGLARADLVVLVGAPSERLAALERWSVLAAAKPLGARLLPRETGLSLEGEKVVAFAGIGRPGKFFAMLRGMGAELAGEIAFPDHFAYPAAVLRRLRRRALAEGAMLVTTEKDAARLPPAFRREAMVVQIYLEPDDWEAIDQLFASV